MNARRYRFTRRPIEKARACRRKEKTQCNRRCRDDARNASIARVAALFPHRRLQLFRCRVGQRGELSAVLVHAHDGITGDPAGTPDTGTPTVCDASEAGRTSHAADVEINSDAKMAAIAPTVHVEENMRIHPS